jgi:hypothetical protein
MVRALNEGLDARRATRSREVRIAFTWLLYLAALLDMRMIRVMRKSINRMTGSNDSSAADIDKQYDH